jgi:hypothetical protein
VPLASQAPCEQASAAAEAAGSGIEEENGEEDGVLYSARGPLASGIELVSLEDEYNAEHIKCYRRCMNNPNPPKGAKKGDSTHVRHCREKCLKEYMDRMRKAGLLKEFSALDAAVEWVKNHGKEIAIGSLIVIGTVVYVISTGGAGTPALTLLPAVL